MSRGAVSSGMRGVALCVASCGWFACASRADTATETTAITQGSSAQDPAVVAIIAGDGTLGCSGTLIAPHTVLTAGHCIPALRRRELSVFFGDSLSGAGTFVAVSDTRVHPQFDPATLAHDNALFTLREIGPVPALSLDPRTFDASLVGQTFTSSASACPRPTRVTPATSAVAPQPSPRSIRSISRRSVHRRCRAAATRAGRRCSTTAAGSESARW